MSWSDFYRRRDAMDAVLEHARRDPEAMLPFAEVPEVAEIFAGPEELLLALHYRWTMRLTGRVSLAQAEAELDPRIDRVDAVAAAWRATAAEFPVLRGLLDANAGLSGAVLRPAVEGEQRMLALAAGLAEPHESPQEITRIGATFLALLRSTPDRQARRRNPVELLRRLVASA
jgi:hypothetical protein